MRGQAITTTALVVLLLVVLMVVVVVEEDLRHEPHPNRAALRIFRHRHVADVHSHAATALVIDGCCWC